MKSAPNRILSSISSSVRCLGTGGLAVLLTVLMLAPSSAMADELNPFVTVTIQGDYVAAGVGLRNSGEGSITISGIPAGASVESAYLYWAILDDGSAPSLADGNFAGNPITAEWIGIGITPCWTVVSNVFTFRADVTPFVSGNGTYDLSGFASGGDSSTPPLAEGATLVVLYHDPSGAERDVTIYEGADTVRFTNTFVSTTLFVPAIGTPGSAGTTYIVADGQTIGGDSTVFNGVVLATDPPDSFNASDGDSWDTDSYDVTALVNTGDTEVTVEIRRSEEDGDCLVHVAQVFSASNERVQVPAVTTTGLLALLLCMGGVALLRARLWRRVRGG